MPQYALRTARFPVNNPATIKLTHYRRTSLRRALAGLSAAGMSSSSGSGRPGCPFAASRTIARIYLLHDITADATGSTTQQILDRSADLCFGVVLIYKIPIELV
jgi:hypothetical protein